MTIRKREDFYKNIMRYYSPLRYPGGKRKLSEFFGKLCLKNKITGTYIEPYAGGASIALHLIINDYVEDVVINDYDRSIFAFWHSVLYHTNDLCKMIEGAKIDIDNWRYQREVQKRKSSNSLLELGFSTFFLNRTNRSGIISGGIIGGVKQKGKYNMDCRFNKEELIERIKFIAIHRKRIQLLHLDALDLIGMISAKTKSKNVIFYFDPPYFLKGQSLYLNSYTLEDHKNVSDKIKTIKNKSWVVSYDDVPEIRSLYKDRNIRKRKHSLVHTAFTPREGKEILFFSDNLNIPRTI